MIDGDDAGGGRRTAEAGTRMGRPVLIGGSPRSGTTLVGAMLGVGPERLTVPESLFKLPLTELVAADDHLDVARALAHLRREPTFRRWGIAVPERVVPPTFAGLFDVLVYAHGARVGKTSTSLWIDHTPENIQHAALLGRLLPEARFVNIVRDGRAVAASILPLDWGPVTVAQAVRWWAKDVACGLAAERALGAERVLSVRFEDVVTMPEEVLSKICDFVDTPFDPSMVARRDYSVGSYTEKMHTLVAEPPDRHRVDGWRTQLTEAQISAYEYHCGGLLELLGYEPLYGVEARLPPRPERVREVVHGFVRRAVTDRAQRAIRRRRLLRNGS